jgi:beta-propeller repeat-containing protein
VYSTYLGGSASENGLMQAGIAVDPAGNAYVTGITESRDFPVTPGAFQPTFLPGSFGADAFLTKLNPAGSGLVYSSYLSGSAGSDGEKVALDASNNAYVVGAAFSSDFPTTPGALQTTLGGPSDAFVSKVSPGPPACGAQTPPVQLQVLVHADQGLASLSVSAATNVDVTLPNIVSGTTDSVLVTGTALDPTRMATFTLQASDVAGSATECTIGGGTPPPPRI